MRLDAVLEAIPGLAQAELEDWVARGWVLPAGEAPDWSFAEIDVARVRLVLDLRHAMGIDEEALPLVLALLDQVYALRRRLRAVTAAAQAQPDPVREVLLAALRG